MRLLITGSREASDAMLNYARACVVRAKELGWSIIVGDAEGVDAAVIDECDKLGVPVEVCGGYKKMRRTTKTGVNTCTVWDYPGRDRMMAQMCEVCMAIWNGRSRGTMITYNEAKKLGKTVHLKKF